MLIPTGTFCCARYNVGIGDPLDTTALAKYVRLIFQALVVVPNTASASLGNVLFGNHVICCKLVCTALLAMAWPGGITFPKSSQPDAVGR